MPTASVNGVQLSYRQVLPNALAKRLGDVVLVHGLAANQAFWNLELVSSLAKEYRVTSFDLRGHGYSSRPATGYSPSDMAIDLRELMDHLNIDTAHIVGHSYGGLISLRLAIDHPRRIRSLTLADTRLRAIAPRQILPTQADWPQLRARLARCGVKLKDDEPEIGMQLLEAIAAPRWAPARERLSTAGAFVPFAARSGGDNRSAKRWLRLLCETTARDDFLSDGRLIPKAVASVKFPVLLAYGQRSPHLASCRRLAELVPHSQTAIIHGGGHFHPASRAEAFARHLADFLGQTDRDSDNTSQAIPPAKNHFQQDAPR